jgi:RNA polymerase sigma factor (sigma-70 family)
VASPRDRTERLHLRSLFHAGSVAGLTDGQLLERFATRDGETAGAAFAALVERHGPMVLRACRGILRDGHAAEDAFQATFLALARGADSLWVRDSLGPWLHRVACRAATLARRAEDRRRAVERRAARSPDVRPEPRLPHDLEQALHEEIDRLPAAFRAAVVLCELEGRTYEDAARSLGCPVGTLKSRLARGRRRLRDRLSRRGLAPCLPGPETWPGQASSPDPGILKEAASKAAVRLVAGADLGSVATASVVPLVKGVFRMHLFARLKLASALVLALGVAALFAASPPRAGARGPTEEPGPPTTPRSASIPPKVAPLTLKGVVRDAEGHPLGEATVVATFRGPGGSAGRSIRQTGPDGAFSIEGDGWPDLLLAYKPGHAPVALSSGIMPVASSIELTLARPEPFSGVVRGQDGAPVRGASVRVATMDGMFAGSGMNINPDRMVAAVEGTSLAPLFLAVSDEHGHFRFPAAPAPARLNLTVTAPGMGRYQTGMVPRKTTSDGGRSDYFIPGSDAHPAEVTLMPEARVVGRVVTRLPGVGVGDIAILLQGCDGSSRQGGEARTHADGRFEIGGLSEGTANIFPADQPADGPWTCRAARDVRLRPGEVAEVEIELIRGALVEGRVVRAELLKGYVDPSLIRALQPRPGVPEPEASKSIQHPIVNLGDGRVYIATDTPQAGVHIGMYGPARPDSGAAILSQVTAADGTFRFRLPPGPTRIYVTDGRYGGIIKPVTIPEDVEVVRLPTFMVWEESRDGRGRSVPEPSGPRR